MIRVHRVMTSMVSPWSVAVLCTGLVVGAWGLLVPDFDDYYRNYDLIYHSSHHLLLAINSVNCYFANIPTSVEHRLDHHDWNSLNLHSTEESLVKAILNGEVHNSTLAAMRDKYEDLLADYHCLHNNIFTVNFLGYSSACDGIPDGPYPHPTNCHKYIECFFGLPTEVSCTGLTSFNATVGTCVYSGHLFNC